MTDKTEAQPEALRLADEQVAALLAIANGAMKFGKLPLEPFVRGYSELRRLHAEVERLTAALKKANDQTEHFEREWYLRGDEIEQLKAQLSQAQAVPDGWKLVPAEPTEEMVAAAEEAHMPFGDMQIAILLALSAAPPPPEREPLLPDFPVAKLNSPACWCETCDTTANSGLRSRMSLCPDCGNKRCPKATNHVNACTNSNAPGQPGSSWEHVKPHGISAAIRARGTGGGE